MLKTPIGSWIREQRKLKKVTQEKLAFAIDVSYEHCRKFESGARIPSIDTWRRIAEYFKIDEDAQKLLLLRFYGGEKEPELTQEQPVLKKKSLPKAYTSFVGRDREVADVCALVKN